jgi:hypothetical protein
LISGYFDPNFAQPVPMVRVALFLPGITRDWVIVPFLLDTGADDTCLHPTDAIFRVRIPADALSKPDMWSKTTNYGGIGGSNTYYIVPAEFAFRHDDGRWQRFSDQLSIAQPTPGNQSLESLLGWNLPQHFKIVADWTNRLITLE